MSRFRSRLDAFRDRVVVSFAYRNPRAVWRRRRQLRIDREIAERVNWPRCVVIVGLPKAGTTWLASLVSGVPGYGVRNFVDPDRCTLRHDVCDSVFTTLPRDVLSVLKVHTRPAPENVAVIERHAPRVVVLYRDPRDVSVSRYFHVLAEVDHRHHDLYAKLDQAEGMRHSIEVVLDEFVPWIRGWRSVVARDDVGRYVEMRYCDLRADPAGQLGVALRHWGISFPAADIARIVDELQSAARFGLSNRSILRGSTARKGIVGDWRNYFTRQHVELFAERAGDLLVELGYEFDDTWARGAGLPT